MFQLGSASATVVDVGSSDGGSVVGGSVVETVTRFGTVVSGGRDVDVAGVFGSVEVVVVLTDASASSDLARLARLSVKARSSRSIC